jgi:hypothetical protein
MMEQKWYKLLSLFYEHHMEERYIYCKVRLVDFGTVARVTLRFIVSLAKVTAIFDHVSTSELDFFGVHYIRVKHFF